MKTEYDRQLEEAECWLQIGRLHLEARARAHQNGLTQTAVYWGELAASCFLKAIVLAEPPPRVYP